jgi:3-methylfumaryl-CoA hydratase
MRRGGHQTLQRAVGSEKHGRSGPLTLVVVRHQVLQQGRVVIDEEQDIAYREAASPAAPASGPAAEGPVVPAGAGEWAIEITPTLLFRFSGPDVQRTPHPLRP